MAAPDITFFEAGSSPDTGQEIDDDHPVDFGTVEKGITSDTITINVWNDRTGDTGSDTATAPRFYAISVDDISAVFDGTAYNNFVSMLEARSCSSYGVVADQQAAWTPIGPGDYLILGDMPARSMRTIELRLKVPVDATAMPTSQDFEYRVSL